MKIICICQDSVSTNCVASGLIDDHEIALLIVPDFNATRPETSDKGEAKQKKPKKKRKRNLFSRIANRLFFTVVQRKVVEAKVDEVIRQQGSGKLDLADVCSNVVTVPTYQMNSKSTAELIASHEADIMFVCGAPILRERIFGIPKYGAVNFHYGYSPKYRGQHTLLWAYNRGDHKSLGGTFLKIDKGVDTGGPVVFAYPEVDPSDSIEAIEAKLALVARSQASNAVLAAKENRVLADEVLPEGASEFVVRFDDYRIKDHLWYHLQRLRNRFLRGGALLREEEVTPR